MIQPRCFYCGAVCVCGGSSIPGVCGGCESSPPKIKHCRTCDAPYEYGEPSCWCRTCHSGLAIMGTIGALVFGGLALAVVAKAIFAN